MCFFLMLLIIISAIAQEISCRLINVPRLKVFERIIDQRLQTRKRSAYFVIIFFPSCLLLIITSCNFYRTLYYFFIQFRFLIDNRTFVYLNNESEKFIKMELISLMEAEDITRY